MFDPYNIIAETDLAQAVLKGSMTNGKQPQTPLDRRRDG